MTRHQDNYFFPTTVQVYVIILKINNNNNNTSKFYKNILLFRLCTSLKFSLTFYLELAVDKTNSKLMEHIIVM